MNQRRRGMDVDTRCPLCFRFDEDGGHIFLKCKLVKQLWRQLQLEDVREELKKCRDQISVLETVFSLQEEKKLTICCALWLWWNERNKANAGDKIRSLQQTVSSVMIHTMDYRKLIQEKPSSKKTKPGKWKLPLHNYVKINIDGAFHKNTNTGGWGFIVRNECGFPVAAGVGHSIGIQSALHAEAFAMLQAIKITSQMGCNKVQLEMDATELKKAVTTQDYDLSQIGPLFKEIKSLLGLAYDDVKLLVCKRTCNNVAHVLANQGAMLEDSNQNVWIAELPHFVTELCAGELASLSV
jgi:ribonuclease HI